MPAFIFELATFGRTFRLGASSDRERTEWIDELTHRIDQRTGIKSKVCLCPFPFGPHNGAQD